MSVEISLVCPVGPAFADLAESHREFADVIASTGRTAEFIYVVDGPREEAVSQLGAIQDDRFRVRILRMARGFGEATAMQIGFQNSRGKLVLTIPDRPQIEARTVLEVLAMLDAGHEVVVTRRWPRIDPFLNRIQARIFHRLVGSAVQQRHHDLTCGLRGFSRKAAFRLDLYGDHHRFIPVIASRQGYDVLEIEGAQHEKNQGLRLQTPGVYARRLLDILNILFLARFTRKPLRFFGLIGLVGGLVGLGITGYLGVQRLLGLSPLANRPLLLLGVLLIVLGVQITAIGLLGEIIIFFASKRDIPEVEELISSTEDEASQPHANIASSEQPR
jgi:glycosyltransferase involved in cell wall biosynthesis